MTTPLEILDFWFAPEARPLWFARDDGFDQKVREALSLPHRQAVAGELEDWRRTPAGCLALLLLFDQVPRNIFRGTAGAYATDPQALALAHHMIDHAHDLGFRADRRLFVYLPFEHAEDLEAQRLSVFLIRNRIGRPTLVAYAERHLRIIERFGRFPQRNTSLGRDSTPEELAFLQESESTF
jgi:uncharacterized protein (DUF924 family)